jgi:hypothetical protein
MPTNPRTVNSAGLDGKSHDARKTESGTVAEELDSFDDDLHAGSRAGQHAGVTDVRHYTAFDVKELHERMQEFDKGDLKRIPILAHGERLEQGGIYLDLNDREKGAFTAQGSMEAQDPHLYVPKNKLDYELWNRLCGEPAQKIGRSETPVGG